MASDETTTGELFGHVAGFGGLGVWVLTWIFVGNPFFGAVAGLIFALGVGVFYSAIKLIQILLRERSIVEYKGVGE